MYQFSKPVEDLDRPFRTFIRMPKDSPYKWIVTDDANVEYTNEDPSSKDIYFCFYSPIELKKQPLSSKIHVKKDPRETSKKKKTDLKAQFAKFRFQSNNAGAGTNSDTSSTSHFASSESDNIDSCFGKAYASSSEEPIKNIPTDYISSEDDDEESQQIDPDEEDIEEEEENVPPEVVEEPEPVGDTCKEFEDFEDPFVFAPLLNIAKRLASVEQEQVLKELPAGSKLGQFHDLCKNTKLQ